MFIFRSLLQPLRFENHFEFKLPSFDERDEIFRTKLKRVVERSAVSSELISEIVKATHGFSGADIDRLICQTVMNSVSREESLVPELHIVPNREDFFRALEVVGPSTLVEFAGLSSAPAIYFSDFAGIDDIIETLKVNLLCFLANILQMNVIAPLKNPQGLKDLGVHPPSGVIFHGPPGTGKTRLAHAVACEAGVNFIEISGAMIVSKYAGDGPRAVSKVFELARKSAPCILFIDQVQLLSFIVV